MYFLIVSLPASDSSDNPLWYLGEQQTVSGITELRDYEIAIWQQYPEENVSNYSGVVFCKLPFGQMCLDITDG